jgi:hypothetical protein
VISAIDAIFAVTRPSKWTSLLLDYPEVIRDSPVPERFRHDRNRRFIVHARNRIAPTTTSSEARFHAL